MRRKLVVIIYADALDVPNFGYVASDALRAAAAMLDRGDVGDVFTNLPGTDRHGMPIGVVGYKSETWPHD